MGNKARQARGLPAIPKPCCRNPANLGAVTVEASGLTYRRCTVCQCRHFRLEADTGRIGMRGTAIG